MNFDNAKKVLNDNKQRLNKLISDYKQAVELANKKEERLARIKMATYAIGLGIVAVITVIQVFYLVKKRKEEQRQEENIQSAKMKTKKFAMSIAKEAQRKGKNELAYKVKNIADRIKE